MTTAAPPPPPLPPADDRGHFRRLDGLRGVAVLMVVAFHCFGETVLYKLPWQPGGLFPTLHPPDHVHVPRAILVLYPLTWGWAGVAVFFVLSGFVIHHAHLRAGGRFRPAAFAARRLLRIYPPYAVALLAFTACWAASAPVDGRALLVNVAAHAALVHNWFPGTYATINPSMWSMGVEVQFYALYPLLLWTRRVTSVAGPLVLTTLLSAGWWAVLAARTDWRGLDDVPVYPWLNTLPLWSSWTLGMFLADRFAVGRRVFARPRAWGSVMAAAGAAATCCKPTWPLAFPLFAVAAAVVIERSLHPSGWDWLGRRWIVRVGLVSYSLYLWHQPLLIPLRSAMGLYGKRPVLEFAALLAVGGTVSVAVATLSYAVIERPSQRLARRLTRPGPA